MTPELHRPLGFGMVPEGGREERLVASEAECAALARRFRLPALHALSAVLRLSRDPDGAIRAEGRLTAEVTQECIVTLDPVRQAVDAAVALRFLPAGAALSEDPEAPDEIETDGRVFDLGEAVAEQLALALDPYPRRPDLPPPPAAEDPEAAPPSPFAALAALKRG